MEFMTNVLKKATAANPEPKETFKNPEEALKSLLIKGI